MSDASPDGEKTDSIEPLTEAVLLLDELAPSSDEPWTLLQRFGAATRGAELEASIYPYAVQRALAYTLVEDTRHQGSVKIGVEFSSHDGSWPPGLGTLDAAETDAWSAVSERATDTLVQVHFSDLLFSANKTRGPVHGRRIAEGYLALASEARLDGLYSAFCLRRAWSLARMFAFDDLEATVRSALFDSATESSESMSGQAGRIFSLLAPLTVPPRAGDFVLPSRVEIRGFLQKIAGTGVTDAILLDSTCEVLERLAESPEEISEARSSRVEGYLALANATAGFLRVSWLQQAASLAQLYGLTGLRARAVVAMQNIDVEDLGLQKMAADTVVPRFQVDARLASYRMSVDARNAVSMWLTTPCPTGSHEQNKRQSLERSSRGILQFVQRTTLTEGGLPLRTGSGPEHAQREALEMQEEMASRIHGSLLAGELRAIADVHGQPGSEQLSAYIAQTYSCDLELARAWVGAVRRFWEGSFEDATRRAYPLVEAAVRGLLLTLGAPLYRVETGGSDGRFPSLESYCDALELEGFDPDWLRAIRNPTSRMRNAIAHGHSLTFSSEQAAFLLRIAGCLVILTSSDSSSRDRSEVDARIRDPLGHATPPTGLPTGWKRLWTTEKLYVSLA